MSEHVSSRGRGATAAGEYEAMKGNSVNIIKSGHSNSVAQGGNQNTLKNNTQFKNPGSMLLK